MTPELYVDRKERELDQIEAYNEPILKRIYDLKGWINQWEGNDNLENATMALEADIEELKKQLIPVE